MLGFSSFHDLPSRGSGRVWAIGSGEPSGRAGTVDAVQVARIRMPSALPARGLPIPQGVLGYWKAVVAFD
jgi:hypothetical protein